MAHGYADIYILMPLLFHYHFAISLYTAAYLAPLYPLEARAVSEFDGFVSGVLPITKAALNGMDVMNQSNGATRPPSQPQPI